MSYSGSASTSPDVVNEPDCNREIFFLIYLSFDPQLLL